MAEKTTIETLRKIAFLEGIADEHLQKLAEIGEEEEFDAFTIIFREHDPSEKVYLVVNGNVSVVICAASVGCRHIAEVKDGELLGWAPVIDRPRLSATGRTLEKTRVVALDGQALRQLCKDDLTLGFEFMHRTASVLADRLSSTRVRFLQAGYHQLPEVALESD